MYNTPQRGEASARLIDAARESLACVSPPSRAERTPHQRCLIPRLGVPSGMRRCELPKIDTPSAANRPFAPLPREKMWGCPIKRCHIDVRLIRQKPIAPSWTRSREKILDLQWTCRSWNLRRSPGDEVEGPLPFRREPLFGGNWSDAVPPSTGKWPNSDRGNTAFSGYLHEV
ncbi:hypothetical protein LZ30DRAFT_734910 [Colletotrichum cereale]|nr:hypothetical protein LZ30DRAFT_734910 [Colletotrichum cereale]